jgi:hypothetical protein
MMQDGRSRCAYWDGQVNRHLRPGPPHFETPQGLWMEFVGSRLWISRGPEIFASDIQDPLHYIETQYLTGGGSLQTMDGNATTGLARTADNKALVAFSSENTTIIAAAITDRNSWQSTPNFISILFPGVGCTSGKSITYSNGELCWFSKEGARRFTQVGSTIQVSKNNLSSSEMQRSYKNLSGCLDRACAFSYNGFVGFSVPSGDTYNRHTWVFDMNTQTMTMQDAAPAWQGIWMGTRPVEWVTRVIDGADRCFHLSQDSNGGVYVWEAFQKNQQDDSQRIFFSLETKGMNFGEPISFKKLLYSEFHLLGLRGQLDLTVEYRSDYTCWQQILSTVLCAEECHQLECSDTNQAAGIQSRYVKTAEAQHGCSIPPIGPFSNDIATYFQNRIRGYGRFGMSKYRSFANQYQESSVGACFKGDVDGGVINCKEMLCCDEEVDYKSNPDIQPYGYGSTFVIENSV